MKRIRKEMKEEGGGRCARRGEDKIDECENMRRRSKKRVRLKRNNRRDRRSGQRGRKNRGRDKM
jgi:hypothetical protein